MAQPTIIRTGNSLKVIALLIWMALKFDLEFRNFLIFLSSDLLEGSNTNEDDRPKIQSCLTFSPLEAQRAFFFENFPLIFFVGS